MHDEEDFQNVMIADLAGVKGDLNDFCMPSIASVDMLGGRVFCVATRIAGLDFGYSFNTAIKRIETPVASTTDRSHFCHAFSVASLWYSICMATTKKSTKAKTNTAKSKKPVTKKLTSSKKPATKSVAAKSKKTPTKVAKVVKPTKVSAKKVAVAKQPLSPTELLRRLNQVSAFVHVAGAIAAFVLMSKASVQIFTGLVARDELASNTQTVFVPAIHHLYDVQVKYAVVAVLLVGAVVPIINVVKQKRYEKAVKAKANPLRWINIAVLSGAVLGIVAALSGVQDFMTLKLVGGLIVTTAALGWLSERQNSDSKAKPDRSAFGISLFTGALPWLVILAFAFGTPLWGMIRYPWYVYALYGTVFASSAAYAINGYNYMRRFRNWTKYEVVERNYVLIDVFARVSFAAILIIGLSK